MNVEESITVDTRATYKLPVASATGPSEAGIESPEGDTIRPSMAMKC